MKVKLSAQLRQALHEQNLAVGSLWQPPTMFKDNGRKLKNVAEPGDPWIAQVFYPAYDYEKGENPPWYATMVSWGKGETAEAAVVAAMNTGNGLNARLRALGAAFGELEDALRGYRTRLS